MAKIVIKLKLLCFALNAKQEPERHFFRLLILRLVNLFKIKQICFEFIPDFSA